MNIRVWLSIMIGLVLALSLWLFLIPIGARISEEAARKIALGHLMMEIEQFQSENYEFHEPVPMFNERKRNIFKDAGGLWGYKKHPFYNVLIYDYDKNQANQERYNMIRIDAVSGDVIRYSGHQGIVDYK